MRAGRPRDRRQHFEQRLEALKVFRKQYNKWPEAQASDAIEKSIGTWCKKLKELYKLGRLDDYRIDRLQQAGYPMDFIEAKWQEKFALLKTFIEQEQKLPAGRHPLYSFCYHQYRFAKRIDDRKTAQLKAIGFFDLWGRQKEDVKKKWDLNFKKLVQFIRANGGLPRQRYDAGLFTWLQSQKQLYRKGQLNKEKLGQFELAGIDSYLQRPSTRSWEEKWKDLQVYHLIHGELPMYKIDRKLYGWLSYQRSLYGQNKLDARKIKKLNSIDVNWWQKRQRRKIISVCIRDAAAL